MPTLVTMIACLASFGCGNAPAAKPAPLPPVSAFAISYSRGGGIAPSAESLVVRPGRRAVAKTVGTRAGERTVRFQIGPGRVLALERSLRRARFFSIESPGESGCADCFFYALAYRGHRVEIDESQMPERLRPVISELGEVISARTIPPNF